MKTKRFKGVKAILMVMCFILCSAGSPAQSAEVTLAWDPNTEPELAGYNVYQAERIGDHSTAWNKIETLEPDEQTGIIPTEYTFTVDDQKNWAWQVTAFDSKGNESRVSNMVEFVDRTPPNNPKNLHKIE